MFEPTTTRLDATQHKGDRWLVPIVTPPLRIMDLVDINHDSKFLAIAALNSNPPPLFAFGFHSRLLCPVTPGHQTSRFRRR